MGRVNKNKKQHPDKRRKRSQLVLLGNLFDAIPYAILYIDHNHTCQYCNKGYERLTGFSLKNIQGKLIIDLLSKEIAENITAMIKNVLHTQKEAILNHKFEFADGKSKLIKLSILPFFDSFNKSFGVVMIEEDITFQQESETHLIQQLMQLQKSRDDTLSYLENIISHFPANVYWKDTEGRILGDNLSHAKMAGFNNQAEVIGKTDYDFPWQRQADQIRLNDLEVMRTKQTQVFEEVATLKEGDTENTFLTIKAPLFNSSKEVVGIVGISMDITERKKMEIELRVAKERAEAASQAKSIFISNMSHDIRTPLTGVIGLSNILEQEGDTQKDRELAHSIHLSSERLLQLLDDVLEVISADKIQENSLNLTTFNLPARFAFIENLLVSNTQQHNVKLIFAVDKALPEYIVGDRIKVERILLNLISNAMKFTPSGSITVSASLFNNTEQDATLRLQISDTGIGIPPDQIDKIFDRFYRIDPSYHNKYKGHGIGLFIVHKYVDLLKGKITVQSEIGKGTAFVIDLPVKVGSALDNEAGEELPDMSYLIEKNDMRLIPSEDALANTIIQPKTIETEGAFKVLVIEDDTIARHVVKSMLTGAGFEVEDVEDAEQGFGHVMRNSYDLILTDIGLPLMNGIEFTKTVRAWEKITSHAPTPIVGLTAHGKSQQETAYKAGMNMLFSKPLDEQKLAAINKEFFPKVSNSKEITSLETKPKGLGYDLPDTEEELFDLNIYPILDVEEGIKTLGGDLNFLKEILSMLVNQTMTEELPLLVKAHDEGDWGQVQSIAHKLKGAALYCSTIRLRYACQYTERYRLAGHNKLLEPLYQQLLVEIEGTRDYLKEWLMQNGID